MDAIYLKAQKDGRVQGMASVVAMEVNQVGERRLLGFDLGPTEDKAFWLQFLRSLVARELGGVQLATSDAHEGLKQAIGAVFQCVGHLRVRTKSWALRRDWEDVRMYSREERMKATELYVKYEMFYNRSWAGVSIDGFMDILDQYLNWYNDKRIKMSLGAMSPVEYRNSLGLAV